MGYFSGINAFVKDTYDIQGSSDLEGHIGFLAKYCEENPLKQFSLALDSLVVELFQIE